MKELICSILLFSGIAAAQVRIPEGVPVRVRLEEDLSSATAQEGQNVRLTVVDETKVADTVAIAAGAPVMGRITTAVPKRLASSGKLDFSIERVTAADGAGVSLRYSADNSTAAKGLPGGIVGAGASIVFGPTIQMLRLMTAKDVTMPKGMIVTVFTNEAHTLKGASAGPQEASPKANAIAANPENKAAEAVVPLSIVSITSTPDGARITVDGTGFGETPASFQLDPGNHELQLQKDGFVVWKKTLSAKSGTPIDIDAQLTKPPAVSTKSKAGAPGAKTTATKPAQPAPK